MQIELIKEVLDFYSNETEKLHIRFAGGGEPFINFELMKFAVDYAKKKFKEITIHTITNGTFNDEQFEWLKDNKSFIRISFDGVAQKYQRPFQNGKDSSDLVIKNIKRVIQAKLPLAVQMIVTSKSIGEIEKTILLLYDLGVENIKLEPVYISKASRGNENLMIPPKEFVNYFIKAIKLIRENNWKMVVDTSFISRPSTGFYCSMPEGNNILTPEGYITSCVEISKKCEPFSDLLLYARFNPKNKKIEIDKNKLNKLNQIHFTNFQKCKNCNLKLICKGGCPMRHFWIMGDGSSQNNYSCQISKILIPEILTLISQDKEYAKILFQNFNLKT